MHSLTTLWWERFVNRTDGTLRKGREGWVYTPHRLTIHELDAALRGEVSLGVYAVDEEGMSRWLCLDADTDEGRSGLAELATTLDRSVTLFELSRRGAHLWCCCPPTSWQEVRAVGQALIDRQGIDCEVFPKGPGRNGVRLPLTRHPRSNVVYPVVDPATGEIRAIDDLLNLACKPLPVVRLPRPVKIERRSLDRGPEAFHELWREVELLTRLRQYGPEKAIGRCPFHDDRHPSLSLLGGFWRCWAGCGEGGIAAWRARQKREGRSKTMRFVQPNSLARVVSQLLDQLEQGQIMTIQVEDSTQLQPLLETLDEVSRERAEGVIVTPIDAMRLELQLVIAA